MNTFDPNDPRLTAYALGELTGADAAEIENLLRQDAALQQSVQDVRRTAQLVSEGLAAETSPGLTALQRERIARRPEPLATRPLILRARTWWMGAGLAAAACLAIAVILTFEPSSRDRFAIGERQAPANERVNTDESERRLGLEMESVAGQSAGTERMRREMNESLLQMEVESSGRDHDGLTQPGSASLPPGDSALRKQIAGRAGLEVRSPSAPPRPPSTRLRLSETEAETRGEGGGVGGGEGFGGGGGAGTAMPLRPAQQPPSPVTKEGVNAPASVAPRKAAPIDVDRKDTAGEKYALIVENAFTKPDAANPSTFSIDVDTASFSNVRRFINNGQLPPPDEVRLEEMINYFPYRYGPPSGGAPFSASVEVNAAPWNDEHRLVRIGLRGKDVPANLRPATSLVFLIDVSGSMNQPRKLPLVKESLKLLVNELHGDDRLAIVTYAGEAGVPMESMYCTGDNKRAIVQIIDGLKAGGATNGAGGIHAAYERATQNYIKGGVNRVILCTDGDFNVGASSEAQLVELIQEKRASGVYLSVLGFGEGNFQDAKMKQLSMHGNGNFAFIDRIEEGRKALVEQMSGTLVTIAKDVKIQVAFDPEKVSQYRLIGYENRVMAAEDFQNDLKDAGEIGAGHTVTALYEVQPAAGAARKAGAAELGTLSLRYKDPDGEDGKQLDFKIADVGAELDAASPDFKLAAAAAAFGMTLRDSPYKGQIAPEAILDLAAAGLGAIDDKRAAAREEFQQLIERAIPLLKNRPLRIDEAK